MIWAISGLVNHNNNKKCEQDKTNVTNFLSEFLFRRFIPDNDTYARKFGVSQL